MQSATPTLWSRFRGKFIGDRQFYRSVFSLIVPIIIQNTISNVVSLLDNVMVGALGTIEMTGVSIANQVIFVYMLAVFGGIGTSGVYGAQFVGAHDWEHFRQTIRLRLIIAMSLTAIGIGVIYFFKTPLLSLFLTGEGSAEDAAQALAYGEDYADIILISLVAFGFSQCYASALRETGETFVPMIASIAAILVNLVFNYFLIFGKFGFPVLGVRGAAIATMLSRFVELAILMVRSHTSPKYHFMKGLYTHFHIDKPLAKEMTIKSMPLLINELLWSMAMSTITAIYSTYSLIVVPAFSISSTVSNIFNTFYMSTGTAVAIMVGQALGANEIEEARRLVWKIMAFSVMITLVVAVLLYIAAAYIPLIYNVEPEVRTLATSIIRVGTYFMIGYSITHCGYFAMRSGGKTVLTMLFDCGFAWGVNVPAAYFAMKITSLPIEGRYLVGTSFDLLKMIICLLIVRTGIWAKNIAADKKA